MPMVFWASLAPWLKPMNAALTICSRPKTLLTKDGRFLRRISVRRPMMIAPRTKPISGDRIIGLMSLGHRPM